MGIVIMLAACKEKNDTSAVPAPAETKDSTVKQDDSIKSYLPIADFIQEDMRKADSSGAGILRKRTINGKKDSGYIQMPEFHRIARGFLLGLLDTASFQHQFNEASLFDQTTQSMDFIYSANTDSTILRKAIVYIIPTPAKDKVDRIYMERQYMKGDTAVQEKLTWKMQRFFYILTFLKPANGQPTTKIERVIWEPQDYHEE